MTKFRIEIMKPFQILLWFGIADFVAIASFSIVFLLNITITDKTINFNVANHKSRSIPISNIISVRYKNKSDYVVRGNPVFGKNVIALEFLSEKGEKNTLFFSVSNPDSEYIITLLIYYGCNFEVRKPQIYK